MFDIDLGDSAISPVVSVILMVAVTVILAAVIGSFVLDMGSGTQQNPQAGVSVSENADGSATVTIISKDYADEIIVRTDDGNTEQMEIGDSEQFEGDFTVIGVLDGKETTLQTHDVVAESSEYTVGSDDSSDYETIAAAVETAGDGDTVRVQSGTYELSNGITITDDITLVADGDVALEGYMFTGNGITIGAGAAPTIDGFSIVNYRNGVNPSPDSGEWVLKNTSITSITGIYADSTTSDWHVENVTVSGGGTGIEADDSSGDWTVSDSSLNNLGDGISATNTTGSWTVENSEVINNENTNMDSKGWGIIATGANPAGDASTSTVSGNEEGDCKGNVVCP